MGSFLSRPNTAPTIASGEAADGRLKYGACEMQGWRSSMEDAHIAVTDLVPGKKLSLFCVFDGHGGAEVALYAKEEFTNILQDVPAFRAGKYGEALRDAFLKFDEVLRLEPAQQRLAQLCREHDAAQAKINRKLDASARDEGVQTEEEGSMMSMSGEMLNQLIQRHLLAASANHSSAASESSAAAGSSANAEDRECEHPATTADAQEKASMSACDNSTRSDKEDADSTPNAEVQEGDGDGDGDVDVDADGEDWDPDDGEDDFDDSDRPGYASGCTAVAAIIDHSASKMWVANAGDSRCIIVRAGKAVALSEDHKPEDEEEESRIIAAGGHVTSEGRVNGNLNLSRSLGDLQYKADVQRGTHEQFISAHADVVECSLRRARDTHVVLMCDGITGVLSDQEVADKIRAHLASNDLASCCEKICRDCIAESNDGDGTGCDNETLLLVEFVGDALAAEAPANVEQDPHRMVIPTTACAFKAQARKREAGEVGEGTGAAGPPKRRKTN